MGKWTRGVSIIGAAYTPFGNVLETPEIKGMTYRELLTWAALEALEGAGITPKDVDSMLVYQLQNQTVRTLSTNAVAAQWLGLNNKPSVRFETACASGANGVRLAGSLIASGIDDIVLLVGAEVLNSIMDDKTNEYRKQPAERLPVDAAYQTDIVMEVFDEAYIQPVALGGSGMTPVNYAYAKHYGVTLEQVDEAMSATAINNRRNAARNPRAMFRKEYKEIAKEAGFSDAMSFMKSDQYNPRISTALRMSHCYTPADGAAALVLCPAEDAKKYTKMPIDVIGIGTAAGTPYEVDPIDSPLRESAFDQAYSMANLNPKEIGYMSIHDATVNEHLLTSEIAGYFGKGESWQAFIEGRTAFDGDKPINTHGGCTSMGNVYGVSGIAEIVEAFKQIRGECGERQMTNPPKVTVSAALGGGPNFGVTVLRKRG